MSEFVLYGLGFLAVSFGFVAFFGAPYVPTLRRDRNDLFELYHFNKNDVFVDIGSGDGVLLREAAQRNVQMAIGYELNPWLYVISRLLGRKYSNITICLKNFWQANIPDDTTVIYTFLNGRYMPRLRQKLEVHVKRTGRPVYFISYGFEMAGAKKIKSQGAMHLYQFAPLQT